MSGVADAKPQLPVDDQVFLDHIGWFVPDMDAASRALERLGFLLTPYSLHGDRDPATGVIKPVGTANRLIMLDQGYLEILTTVGAIDLPVAQHMRTTLADRGAGVHLIALAVADATRKAEELTTAGFTMQPTVNLRRTLEAENRMQAEVAFTVVRPAFAQFPECRMQALTHHTPEHMWQRRYMAQPNGIVGLENVSVVVSDLMEAASRFGRFSTRRSEGEITRVEVLFDRGKIELGKVPSPALRAPSPSREKEEVKAPYISRLGLISRDLDFTRCFLADRGVGVGQDADRLIVDPVDALGVELEITASS